MIIIFSFSKKLGFLDYFSVQSYFSIRFASIASTASQPKEQASRHPHKRNNVAFEPPQRFQHVMTQLGGNRGSISLVKTKNEICFRVQLELIVYSILDFRVPLKMVLILKGESFDN